MLAFDLPGPLTRGEFGTKTMIYVGMINIFTVEILVNQVSFSSISEDLA